MRFGGPACRCAHAGYTCYARWQFRCRPARARADHRLATAACSQDVIDAWNRRRRPIVPHSADHRPASAARLARLAGTSRITRNPKRWPNSCNLSADQWSDRQHVVCRADYAANPPIRCARLPVWRITTALIALDPEHLMAGTSVARNPDRMPFRPGVGSDDIMPALGSRRPRSPALGISVSTSRILRKKPVSPNVAAGSAS